jgi:hypothetical protein
MALRAIAFLAAGCFVLPGFAQVIVVPAVQAGAAASSPSLDAAKNAAAGADNVGKQGVIPRTTNPGGLFSIQGDGIGLPSGVGERRCTSVNQDGKACSPDAAGKNPVAEKIDRGAERDPGVARPTDTSIQGAGVGVPVCFGDSRDSASCR